MDEKTKEIFRQFGRDGWKNKVKKYGKKGAVELNSKAGKANKKDLTTS